MNILDENIIASQRQRLRSWRIRVRQIGVDLARKGLQDEEILPFLHHLRRPTFFTRDRGFYQREVCHRQYGIVGLEVAPEEVAIFVRRVLRHPRLNTQAKRLGTVVRASHRGLGLWRLHAQEEETMLGGLQGTSGTTSPSETVEKVQFGDFRRKVVLENKGVRRADFDSLGLHP
jgi:hypothetical protein